MMDPRTRRVRFGKCVTMYYLEVYRDETWCLVGQYTTRKQAEIIARDYRSRGELARVRHEHE